MKPVNRVDAALAALGKEGQVPETTTGIRAHSLRIALAGDQDSVPQAIAIEISVPCLPLPVLCLYRTGDEVRAIIADLQYAIDHLEGRK